MAISKTTQRVIGGICLAVGLTVGGGAWWALSGDTAPVTSRPKMPASQEGQQNDDSNSANQAKTATISAAPSLLDFKLQPGGQASQETTLTATGDTAIPIAAINITNHDPAFQIGGTCSTVHVLEPGRSCRLDLLYTAPRVPSNLITTIYIDHHRVTDPTIINVNVSVAEPVQAVPPPGSIRANPSNLAFDNSANERASLAHQIAYQPQAPLSSQGKTPAQEVPLGLVTQDPGYNRTYQETAYPATYATLPVDLSRIVTKDIPIKAQLVEEGICGTPSEITARTLWPTYAAHGRNIMIPGYAKAIGITGQKITNGRCNITWQYIELYNGQRVALTETHTSDLGGTPGVPCIMDNTDWEQYGIPMLSTLLRAGNTLAMGNSTQSSTSALGNVVTSDPRSQAVQQVNQGISDLTKQYLANTVVKPACRIPKTTPIDIRLAQDIYFPTPYKILAIDLTTGRTIDPTVKTSQIAAKQEAESSIQSAISGSRGQITAGAENALSGLNKQSLSQEAQRFLPSSFTNQ